MTTPAASDEHDGRAEPPRADLSPEERAEVRSLARALDRLADWAGAQAQQARRSPVTERLQAHVPAEGRARSVVTRQLPVFQHVNVQVALDAWCAEAGREVAVEGVAMPPHYGGVVLHQLLHGEDLPPLRLAAPDLVDLPSGPGGRTRACWRSALLLVSDARGRWVLRVRGPEQHEPPSLQLEVGGLETADAQAVLDEVEALRSRLDVYRGQVVELAPGDMGGAQLRFADLPPTRREDVVLPEEVLRRVERHSIEVARHRTALREAGQHLKRGLLLHGPPGTGKTHTTRYVVQHVPDATVLLLAGRALALVGEVAALARSLAPSVVVLEDVDLVAEDRGFGSGASPVLFELLDAMDGAASDADLLFLLTTNRADLLEPALAARPGRVDVAVEIGLPDADGRRRLLDLYAAGVPTALTEEDLAAAVERTEGVTASFVKELLRRAVLESLEDSPGALREVRGEHLQRALDDLLDSTQSVTRALLGVPADQSGPPLVEPVGEEGASFGWVAGPGVVPHRYVDRPGDD
ncbi:ATP-binding protein [uncultured Pseudokineococcus sp.]|uniref:AAA family ATPase n=1 Tax=uncultured Pseudokineococcus sp. TaxID=1642928 RepID=UPI002639FA7C|nr:ATP-binding protein [uncultured Pseudokineococcus sp.]